MKKRVISTMLALALVLGLMPVLPVSAAGTLYYKEDTANTGTVSYDSATNTLTLTDATLRSDVDGKGAIDYYGTDTDTLTVVLVGSNTVYGNTGSMADVYGISVSQAGLKITGSGSLEIIAESTDHQNNCYGIRVINGDLEILDTTVTVKAAQATTGHYVFGIAARGDIDIKNSTVKTYAQHNGAAAVGDRVDVVAGIYADGNWHTISITSDSFVDAKAGKGGHSCGISGDPDTTVRIDDSTVTAIGGLGSYESSGISAEHVTMTNSQIDSRGDESSPQVVYAVNADLGGVDLTVPSGALLTTKKAGQAETNPTSIADGDWPDLVSFRISLPSSGGGVMPMSSDPPVVAIPMYWPILETGPGGLVSVTPLAGSEGATMTLIVKPGTGRQVASITARDADGNDVPVSLREDGRYFFIQPDSRVTVTTTFTDRCYSSEYSDLDLEAWYHEATDFVLEKGYMIGTGDSIFDPYGLLDRSQVVTVLWRLEGSPENSDSIYTDVTADDWYLAPLGWATGRDLALGFGDGTFGPTQAVTLEQLAAFLYRYVQYKAGETEIVTGLDAAMEWALQEGLLEGMEGITTPDAPALRVQIAHMLLKVLGK